MLDNLVKIYDDFTKGGRTQDLQQLAKELNYSFSKRDSFGTQTTEIKGLDIFSKKGTKRLIGVIDFPSTAFKGTIRFYDYLNTKDLETATTSIVEVRCEDLLTERFKIQPRGPLRKMKGLFLRSANPFSYLKEFNSKFEIEEFDDGSLLKESAMELMTEFPGITCEAEGNYLVFYYRHKEVSIADIVSMVAFAEEFTRLTKDDLSGDYV